MYKEILYLNNFRKMKYTNVTLLALDPKINKVSEVNLSDSHFGPSLLTGRPALFTKIKSVLGRPRPVMNYLYDQNIVIGNKVHLCFFFIKITLLYNLH